MKKVITLAAVCLLLIGMMSIGFTASAATPKEDIVAAVKEAMPDAYESKYLPMLENVLSQIDVTAEQAEAVIANIKAAKAAVSEDKGESLSEYPVAESKVVMANFDAACTTLGLTYKLVESEDPDHEGDLVCEIYKGDKKIGDADGEGIKKTNAPDVNVAVMIALVSTLALAGGAVVFSKKIAAR